MSNSFNRDELARWYNDVEKCLVCNKYKADAVHHVFSRRRRFSSSILNASCLCNQSCHLKIHGWLIQRKQQEWLIGENAKRLNAEGYKLNELDMQFISEHNLVEIVGDVTNKENCRNIGIQKNNTSGYTGVSYCKKRNLYESKITVNYKTIHLGKYKTAEEAYEKRQIAQKELW